MTWIRWSQTWTTRIKTTTSRKPQRCSSKTLRWKRMYLLLRADRRLKQNHKDVFLPAHPQKLFLIGKRIWVDIELQGCSPTHHSVSKKLMNLLRHGSLPREDDGQGDRVPKACHQQAAADSRGSRTCVCANTSGPWVAHAGGEGWMNILPWYRLVGVAKTSSETQRRESRAARKGKWPPRGTGDDSPHLP